MAPLEILAQFQALLGRNFKRYGQNVSFGLVKGSVKDQVLLAVIETE